MRRGLLAIAIGISFLILLTWLGTILTSIVPHRVTAQVQTVNAGPYRVTIQVNPNPPLITQPATLSIQVQKSSTLQPVSGAHVSIASNMETMEMGIESVEARSHGNGTYVAQAQFSMSGLWQLQVIINFPGAPSATATFEVTAQ